MSRHVREPNIGKEKGVGSLEGRIAWKAPPIRHSTERPRFTVYGDASWTKRKEVVMYQKPTLQRFGTFREVSDWVGLGMRRRAAS